MKKIYGYARVSTKEQHLDRQIKALLDHGIDERDIVSDHASGASLERPGSEDTMIQRRKLCGVQKSGAVCCGCKRMLGCQNR